MKSIVIFYDDDNSKYRNEAAFNGKSAVELSAEWAKTVPCDKIVTISSRTNVLDLLQNIIAESESAGADNIIFTYNDCPFLNTEITKKLLDSHIEYNSEYTFADGYSLGLCPEIINIGTAKILLNLAETIQIEEGQKKVCRQSIFNLIKTDINSFEIETVIADKDWRLLRLNFDCRNKDSFVSCKNLFLKLQEKNISCCNGSINEINEIAEKSPEVLKTVPGFYNIQITDFGNDKCIYCPYSNEYKKKTGESCKNAKKSMNKNDFSNLIKKISDFSENGVIGLSLWGEAFSHPDLLEFIKIILSYKGLSVFIETEGWNISEEFCWNLKNIVDSCEERINGWPPVMIAVQMDSVTQETYSKIHGSEKKLEDVIELVKKLQQAIPGNVYPQFVRMNINEPELENFFRYWKEKENPSAGQFIIQKYDDFAGLLPDEKSADLSPIDRNVCWHLRRDMSILTNGDVILCKEYVLDNIIGNVFKEDLVKIWQKMDCVLEEHINCKYTNKCEKCDESYTYNF